VRRILEVEREEKRGRRQAAALSRPTFFFSSSSLCIFFFLSKEIFIIIICRDRLFPTQFFLTLSFKKPGKRSADARLLYKERIPRGEKLAKKEKTRDAENLPEPLFIYFPFISLPQQKETDCFSTSRN
jgi:hypothetical protein